MLLRLMAFIAALIVLFGIMVWDVNRRNLSHQITETEQAAIRDCEAHSKHFFRSVSTAHGVLIKQYTCTDAHAIQNYEQINY